MSHGFSVGDIVQNSTLKNELSNYRVVSISDTLVTIVDYGKTYPQYLIPTDVFEKYFTKLVDVRDERTAVLLYRTVKHDKKQPEKFDIPACFVWNADYTIAVFIRDIILKLSENVTGIPAWFESDNKEDWAKELKSLADRFDDYANSNHSNEKYDLSQTFEMLSSYFRCLWN